MRAPAAAFGLAALSACLEAPPRGVESDDGGGDPGGDGSDTAVYLRELEIRPGAVLEPLTDFPVLVRVEDDAELSGHATPAGDDISFHDAAGEPLAFEIERWVDGDLLAWVKLPSVPDDDATTFYLRYGPGAPRVDASTAVWRGDFAAVWHLEEPPAEVVDSTAGGHDVVDVIGSPASTAGLLGEAISFDGGDVHLDFGADFPAGVDAGDALTVTAWVRYDAKASWAHFISKATGNTFGWAMGIDIDQDFMVRVMNGTSGSFGWNAAAEPSTDVWYHWAMVFDGSGDTSADRLRAYRDGAFVSLSFQAEIPATFDAMGGPLYLGCATWNPSYCIEGAVDEVHVSPVVRSGGWIAAEFENQRPDSEFLTIGPEEKL